MLPSCRHASMHRKGRAMKPQDYQLGILVQG
jgi:hypothetical protein